MSMSGKDPVAGVTAPPFPPVPPASSASETFISVTRLSPTRRRDGATNHGTSGRRREAKG